MVGCDVTDVALNCSNKHIQANPHLSALLDVRDSRGECSRGENGLILSDKNIQLPDDLQAVCEGPPCRLSLGEEGDKERRPAVRRGLDGHPKVKGTPEERSNLQAAESFYGTSDVHEVHDVEAEVNPNKDPVSPRVCDAGPGPEYHDEDQMPPPILLMKEMAYQAAAETSSIAAGCLLAQVLPNMAIGEIRAGPKPVPPLEPSMEAPVDAVVSTWPSDYIRTLSGDNEANPPCDEALGSDHNGGILMSAFRGATERFTFCM